MPRTVRIIQLHIHVEDFDRRDPRPDVDVRVWAGQGLSGVRLTLGDRFQRGDWEHQDVDISGPRGQVAPFLRRLARMIQLKEAMAPATLAPNE